MYVHYCNTTQCKNRIYRTQQYSRKHDQGVKSFLLSTRSFYSITHSHCAASCRRAALGHITSSTSQAILSLARHRGKNALEWRIHPWKASTGMSAQASSIARTRFSLVYGCLSYTFHLHDEKNSSIGFRKGE